MSLSQVESGISPNASQIKRAKAFNSGAGFVERSYLVGPTSGRAALNFEVDELVETAGLTPDQAKDRIFQKLAEQRKESRQIPINRLGRSR